MAELSIPVVLIVPAVASSAGAAAPYSGVTPVGISGMSADILRGFGLGAVRGTVERKSDPRNILLRRRVRLYLDRDGLLLRETWSDPITGEYSFTGLDPLQRYTAIAYDHEHNFRAEAADNLTPEVPT